MAYLRSKTEERTGFQNGSPFTADIDNQCDFAMVYRLDETSEERVRQYREKGYVIHFMTGISWGRYTDYLYGEYDGINHWDEAQTDRYGNQILHSKDVPYMVPTIAFADYLSVKLRKIVDLGVEAIHVEEPEFWDRAGYSPAFKREYELYYREPWKAPHESADAKYKCSALKAYLFKRTIARVASSLKEYAKVKYNQNLRFYVPTHSLLNYTQWKIVSPEGKLADIPAVDGCIAQVWTGTSREKNWYDGVFAERTFETAYLEYGVMQELVKCTGRKMWFLHDPIEDNPIFDWTDYRENYFRIVTASIMHPGVNIYEICPWPTRVMTNKYPKGAPDAIGIPDEYRTILNNTFNTLGIIENAPSKGLRVGVLSGDCQLYQREYPDCEFSEAKAEVVGTVLREDEKLINEFKEKLFTDAENNRELMLKFMSANALPAFYGLAMPLLKYGVPVRPVLLDNAGRYAGYLDDYDVLLLSYEFMKPETPAIHNAIAQWVQQGGILIYVGNGFDPFHNIDGWWKGKYETAADHLFELLGCNGKEEKRVVKYGKGIAAVWNRNPAEICFSKQNSDEMREFFTEVLKEKNIAPEYKNNIVVEREYITAAAVLDESISNEPLTLKGVYADMFSPGFDIITEKVLKPGENTLLLDLNKYDDCVIGTSSRIYACDKTETGLNIRARGADLLNAYIRVRPGFEVKEVLIDGEKACFEAESTANTILISYESKGKEVNIEIKK